MSAGTRIILTRDDDWWIATDDATGVTSQGQTRQDALENLDEAIDGYEGGGQEPIEAELRDAGIDPGNNEVGAIDESSVFE